jgi:hypothetical protein
MKTFVLFVALAVAVYAHDPTQEVVPEADDLVLPVPDDTFVETSAQEAAQEVAQLQQAAHAKATSFLAKKGANACKALADSTEKAVTDNIAAQQEIINKMDKGAKCSEEGQQAITAMKGKLTKAEKDKKAADKAYNDANDTDVDFGKYKFSSLTKGQCSQFFSSSAYTAAEKKVKEAKDKKSQAAGKVTATKSDVTAAEQAAKLAVTACRCNTYQAHQKALKAANEKVKASNTAAWTEAAHLKCVLKGKAMNQCTVPALPKVKATTLAQGVGSGACNPLAGRKQCSTDVQCSGCYPNNIQTIYRTGSKAQSWHYGCFLGSFIPAERKGTWGAQLLYGNGEYSNSNTAQSAMWGLRHLKENSKSKDHTYQAMDYAIYCSNAKNGGSAMTFYENGQQVSANGVCKCAVNGDSGYMQMYGKVQINADNTVTYMANNPTAYGTPSGAWRLCYTSAKKAKAETYVMDTSIYGGNIRLAHLKITHNGKNANNADTDENGRWLTK